MFRLRYVGCYAHGGGGTWRRLPVGRVLRSVSDLEYSRLRFVAGSQVSPQDPSLLLLYAFLRHPKFKQPSLSPSPGKHLGG